MAAAAGPHDDARRWMSEAEQTSNPVRLLTLALWIRSALEDAVRLRPDDLEVRLDLVRFHTMAPRIAGGNDDEAQQHLAYLAKRDAAMSAFARGYVAYRRKEFGVARHELERAVQLEKDTTRRDRALLWLGWLSQESQQWDDAFEIFEELKARDPRALYEIARTSSFCRCRTERGREALGEYLRKFPGDREARELAERWSE